MWNASNNDFGGGFVTNNPGEAGFGSPAATKQSQRRLQSIVPCSCAMLHKAEQDGDKYSIGAVELGQITIVAKIAAVAPGNSYIEYDLDDDTGSTVKAKQFVEAEDDKAPFREGTYVRVFGSLRTFQGKQSLVAFSMRPVTDMNELSLHLIEVTHAHAVLSRNAQGGAAAGTAQAAATAGGYAGAQDHMGGLTPLQSQVQKAIASTASDHGMSVQEVCTQLRGVPETSVRDAIEFLSNEGHIYSTIDDDHFRATDC